ncbi:Type 1 glutamine amidotransferase-like domain-containing protein [Kribbella sp. NPDC051770]|uniref:Type 1 glutamine amidotransferase-like domain-containing protein n=1 Tax=Kribbella sp. NPDC051770 TaxID=3155413 RepID=UPI00343BB0FC
MKLLLTDSGIINQSITDALVELLGRPIAESTALFVPTAIYPKPIGPEMAYKTISGREPRAPMTELGWKSVGVLELTALPSIDRELWVPKVQEADVLLVGGGDPLFLHYWMQQSGLAELLPTLKAVYVGLSAGSMVTAPRIGADFVDWTPPGGADDSTLGLVDFAIYPHLDYPGMDNTMAGAEAWAATLPIPAYAIDNQTALKVVDGKVEVVSEGQWRLFEA